MANGATERYRMPGVQACDLPADALLNLYAGQQGAYTDCFVVEVDQPVSHPAYVEAFYTTAVFKLERLLLSLFIARPSTDEQARALAHAQANVFSAWDVEARGPDQLLMCDMGQRTRSWLMCAPAEGGGTRLYFGSAVVPIVDRQTGEKDIGGLYRASLGFHKLYSRVLLSSTASRLRRTA
jgi:hypothetical protein